MAGPIENSGSIVAFCQTADAPVSRRSLFFDEIHSGDRVLLCFGADDDAKPPYSVRIRSPSGALILDRMMRALPTGLPQSEPALEFVVSTRGDYVIEIRESRGKNWGRATLHVT
jgi:hypothetical protein